jgi:hypothetical protein
MDDRRKKSSIWKATRVSACLVSMTLAAAIRQGDGDAQSIELLPESGSPEKAR